MLDSISPPSIPRRPKKQSQVDLPNELEAFDRSDTECDNEQMVSLESLESNEANDKIPVIPKRPDRSKSSSKSPSLPAIPKRPQKSGTPGVESSGPVDLPEVENEEENHKSIYDESISSRKHSDDAIEPPESSELNSEIDDRSYIDVSDGDKTPGNTNTKTTIKEDLNIADDNSMHSFDDDLETVLQDRDDNGSSAIGPEISQGNNVPSSRESDIDAKLGEEYTDPDSNSKKASGNRHNENDELSTESDKRNPNEGDIQSNDSEAKMIKKDQEVSNTPKVTDEEVSEDKDSGNIPHIPRRPKKSKFATNESDAKSIEVENLDNTNIIDQKQMQADNKDNNEEASSINETSQSKSETPQLEKNTTKPKAPPKPKKLSSKIAAFQQMFNQETAPPRNSETSKSASKPDLETKNSENKEVPSRLSTDKMKFAQSLQGMMGKGIAMPGMVNPNLHQKIDTEEVESPDKEVKILNVKKGIAKGPRGKKLPKSLKNPVNVEVTPRFNSFVLTIWELNFQADTESNDMEGSESVSNNTEAQKLENNAEILNLENKPEYIMDSESISNSTPASDIKEESSPLKIDNDDVYLGIDKLKTSQSELKNLEKKSIDSTEGSRDIDAENLPEEIKPDNDSAASYPKKLEDSDLELNDKEQHILENQELDLNLSKED